MPSGVCIILLFLPVDIHVYICKMCGNYNDVDKLKVSIDRKD